MVRIRTNLKVESVWIRQRKKSCFLQHRPGGTFPERESGSPVVFLRHPKRDLAGRLNFSPRTLETASELMPMRASSIRLLLHPTPPRPPRPSPTPPPRQDPQMQFPRHR